MIFYLPLSKIETHEKILKILILFVCSLPSKSAFCILIEGSVVPSFDILLQDSITHFKQDILRKGNL